MRKIGLNSAFSRSYKNFISRGDVKKFKKKIATSAKNSMLMV